MRGLYVCLTGGRTGDYAEITWLSIKNTRGRLDILQRSVTASDLQAPLRDEIFRINAAFRSISRTRNFYAHASYEYDAETGELVAIEAYELTNDDTIASVTRKLANKGTLNEIKNATQRCNELNRETHPVLHHLRDALQAHFLELPSLPDGYPRNPVFPPPKRE